MRSNTIRLLNFAQLLSEIGIGIGYLLGLIPYAYVWTSVWVIPLAFVSLALALLAHEETALTAILNVVLAFLSYIPIIGYVFRAAGAVISWMHIKALSRAGS